MHWSLVHFDMVTSVVVYKWIASIFMLCVLGELQGKKRAFKACDLEEIVFNSSSVFVIINLAEPVTPGLLVMFTMVEGKE